MATHSTPPPPRPDGSPHPEKRPAGAPAETSDGFERSVGDTTAVLPIAEDVPSMQGKRDCCSLLMLSGPNPGTVFTVDDVQLVVGRGTESQGRIDDEGLSRAHARVFEKGGLFFVEDMGSTNGTFLSGERLRAPRRLKDGDRLLMGRNTLLRVNIQDSYEQHATRQLYESAVRDGLTHTYNRRYLDERLAAEVAYASRHRSPLSVLMIDLDHFKKINDTHGHGAGDAVLRAVAGALMRMVRTEDLVARFGGEEFLVVARGTDADAALLLAERVRRTVASLDVSHEGRSVRATASIGVASLSSIERPTVEQLFGAADKALYSAKSGGRNRCCLAPPRS